MRRRQHFVKIYSVMSDEEFKVENTTSRRAFLESIFLGGLAVFAHPLCSSFFSKHKNPVTSYTRVSGCPGMCGDQFNSLKKLWIDGREFTKTVHAFRKRGLILSFKQTDDVNSTAVHFVFSSAQAKKDFDDYLVTHKIFHEKKLLEMGLTHETGIG